MTWFVSESDGIETTIRDLDQPGAQGVICWGATPIDATRIIAARALTTRVLASLDGPTPFPQGALAGREDAVADAKTAEAAVGPSPPDAIPLVPLLTQAIKDLLRVADDSAFCPWCESLMYPECHNPACPSVQARRLVRAIEAL